MPEGAVSGGRVFHGAGRDDKVRVNWDLASDCDEETISQCPTKALYMHGATMTADEVLDEVEKDASAYRNSGGGMTLSGGEAAMSPDFATALLTGAHDRGINTAIETAANVPWRFLELMLPHVDTVLHDLKLMDPERHKKWTGVDNKRLLENFKKAYETYPETTFIARRPLIPGVNDDEEDIRAALAFIRPHKQRDRFRTAAVYAFRHGQVRYAGSHL